MSAPPIISNTDFYQYGNWEKVTEPNGGRTYYVIPGYGGEYVFDPVTSNATGQITVYQNPSRAYESAEEARKQQEKAGSLGSQLAPLGGVGAGVLAYKGAGKLADSVLGKAAEETGKKIAGDVAFSAADQAALDQAVANLGSTGGSATGGGANALTPGGAGGIADTLSTIGSYVGPALQAYEGYKTLTGDGSNEDKGRALGVQGSVAVADYATGGLASLGRAGLSMVPGGEKVLEVSDAINPIGTMGAGIGSLSSGDIEAEALLNVLVPGLPTGLINVFGGGKDKYQQQRDAWRQTLAEAGLFGDPETSWSDNALWETATGNKFNFGNSVGDENKITFADGSTGDVAYDIDFDNPLAAYAAGTSNPLVHLMTGGSILRGDNAAGSPQALIVNALSQGAQSNEDVLANARKLAGDLGFTQEQLFGKTQEFLDEGLIDEPTAAAFNNAANEIFGATYQSGPQAPAPVESQVGPTQVPLGEIETSNLGVLDAGDLGGSTGELIARMDLPPGVDIQTLPGKLPTSGDRRALPSREEIMRQMGSNDFLNKLPALSEEDIKRIRERGGLMGYLGE